MVRHDNDVLQHHATTVRDLPPPTRCLGGRVSGHLRSVLFRAQRGKCARISGVQSRRSCCCANSGHRFASPAAHAAAAGQPAAVQSVSQRAEPDGDRPDHRWAPRSAMVQCSVQRQRLRLLRAGVLLLRYRNGLRRELCARALHHAHARLPADRPGEVQWERRRRVEQRHRSDGHPCRLHLAAPPGLRFR